MTNRVSSIGAQRWLSAIGFVLASLSPLTIVRADEPFVLVWPVACELGQTCFVQNFVDHDSSDAAKDFRCGSRTYNNHDGTDIRLIDTQAEKNGASVLAAAAGRVLRTRDGVGFESRPGPACPHMRVAEAPSPIGLRQVTLTSF